MIASSGMTTTGSNKTVYGQAWLQSGMITIMSVSEVGAVVIVQDGGGKLIGYNLLPLCMCWL